MEIEFVSIKVRRPSYGEAVLIKSIAGVVQNITYTLEGADDTPDWFEPYFFSEYEDLRMSLDLVDSWAAFPDWQD